MDNRLSAQRILMILNPAAGKSASKRTFWELARRLEEMCSHVEIKSTQKAGDAYDFARCHGADCDMIVSCGGDGTLNEVVGGMIASGREIPLCHLPLGTTNDIAKTLRLPKTPEEIIGLCGGSPMAVDAGMFNGESAFTYVAAFGAFTSTAYSTPQNMKNKYGYNAYLLGGLRSLQEIKPYEAKIITDSAEYSGKFIYGSMSNSTSIGGVLHLKEDRMSVSDGRLELLLIRYPENPLELMQTLADLAMNKFESRHIILESTSKASFIFDEPAAWTLDGEKAGSFTWAGIETMKHAYRIFSSAGQSAKPARKAGTERGRAMARRVAEHRPV